MRGWVGAYSREGAMRGWVAAYSRQWRRKQIIIGQADRRQNGGGGGGGGGINNYQQRLQGSNSTLHSYCSHHPDL